VKARIGGAWRDLTGGRVFLGGAWRTLKSGKAYIGGAWRDTANFTPGQGTITLTLSTSSVTTSRRLSTVTSPSVTATPASGQTPYTYAWVKQSGDSISATNSTSAITAFQAIGMAVLETRTAVFRCTCTDSLGSSATADVSVSLTRIEDSEELGGGTQ
jgi:hypothetical protein